MIKQLLLLLFALNLALANLTDEAQAAYDAGDEQTAAKIWQKACKAGEARGCARLGFLYQSGKGVEQDDAKASKFYEKACDAGELSGCDSLASLHQNSDEHAKATVTLERACEKGFGLSCYNLAQIYEAGVGVAPDESKALSLYVKACERGYAVVCYYLGGMYADGAMGKNDEATKNSKNALKFYSLACEDKIYEACEALGRLYEDGEAGFALLAPSLARCFFKGAVQKRTFRARWSFLKRPACFGGWMLARAQRTRILTDQTRRKI